MNGYQQLTDRVTTQIECWAQRNKLTLTKEAKKELVDYVTNVAIDRGEVAQAKALSLAQEHVPGLSRIVGRKCP